MGKSQEIKISFFTEDELDTIILSIRELKFKTKKSFILHKLRDELCPEGIKAYENETRKLEKLIKYFSGLKTTNSSLVNFSS